LTVGGWAIIKKGRNRKRNALIGFISDWFCLISYYFLVEMLFGRISIWVIGQLVIFGMVEEWNMGCHPLFWEQSCDWVAPVHVSFPIFQILPASPSNPSIFLVPR
jgi:hypothetical protein